VIHAFGLRYWSMSTHLARGKKKKKKLYLTMFRMSIFVGMIQVHLRADR
jgi:hypothetical protein